MNFYEITEEITDDEDFVEFVRQIQRAPRVYRLRVNNFTK
jgi:predicted nuclease of predicted toxin-antitoxin system